MGLFSLFRRKKDAEPEAALEADEIVSPETLTEALDLTTFWHDSAESDRRHLSAPFDDEMLKSIEEELGYKLPASFVMLMRTHNGGLVNRCRYRVPDPKEGMPDTVYITDILGIGRDAPYSLCGRFGSEFLIDSRRHNKEIGVAVCNTTLPGRALVFLDYRKCGRNGEPSVTYADAMTGMELPLSNNFASFLKGLEDNIVER